MKTKIFCRKCGTQLIGDGVCCPVCRENKRDYDVEERYFPDDPKNKVYAVDVYVTLCKCVKIEAADKCEADRKAADYITDLLRHRTDAEYIHALANDGFSDSEELETRVSGEADKNGYVKYY
jgi:hypothetical protein